jgi:NADH-quinone oxidoreductase subunit H
MEIATMIGYALLSLFIFPGLAALSAISLFTEWFVRKSVARMQNRMGPAYVGPIGLLQPFADFFKLLLVKRYVEQRYSSPLLAVMGVAIGIGALTVTLLLFPISPLRLIASYDVIIFIYLTILWPFLSLIIISLAWPNPFVIAGVSRAIALAIVTEPTLVASILVPMNIIARKYSQLPPYSVYYTSIAVSRLWTGINIDMGSYIITLILLAISIIASIIAIQSKVMLKPFDIPEAEQELIAGFATEFSGPVYAFFRLFHDMEITVLVLAIVYIFLGGPAPFNHLSVEGILTLLAKYIVVLFIVSLIRGAFGRFRIDQAINKIIKYALIPSVIALIISFVI